MHLPGFLTHRVAHDGGNALGMVEVDVGDATTREDADDADGTAVTLGVGVEEGVKVGVGGLGGDVADDDCGVGVAAGGLAGGTTAGSGGRALATGFAAVLAGVATVVGSRRGGGTAVSSTCTTVLLGLVVLASTLLLALLGGGGVSGRRGRDRGWPADLDAAGPGFGNLGSRNGGGSGLGGGLEIFLDVLGGTVGGGGGAGGATRIASGTLLGFLLVGRLGGRLGGSGGGVGWGVLGRSLVLGLLVGSGSLGVGIGGWYLVGSLRSRSSSLLLGGLGLGTGTSSSLLGLGGSLGRLLGLHDAKDVVVDVVLLLPAGRGRVGQDDGVDEGPVGDDGRRAGEVHVTARDEEDGAVDGVLGVDARLGGAEVDGEDVGVLVVVSFTAVALRGLDGVGPREGVVGQVGEEIRLGLALVAAGGGADVLDGRIAMVEVADAVRVVRQHLVVLLDEGPGHVEGVGGPVRSLRLRRRGVAHDGRWMRWVG